MVTPLTKPSVVSGLRSAWRLRRLVVAVWIVGVGVATPAVLILSTAVSPALSRLPSDLVLPAGEAALLVVDALTPVVPPLGFALGGMMLMSWAFTILWHAGLARFEVWGSGPPAVSHILGFGLTAWWPYLRLALTAVCVLLGLLGALGAAAVYGVTEAFTSMAEERMVMVIGLAVAAAAGVKLTVWAATLRGAWELAAPTSRSAIRAWVRGLFGVFRQPLATVAVLVTLGSAAVLCAVTPVVAPMYWFALRGGPGGVALGAVAGLGAAFFSVSLFSAFAPIAGLTTTLEADSAAGS